MRHRTRTMAVVIVGLALGAAVTARGGPSVVATTLGESWTKIPVDWDEHPNPNQVWNGIEGKRHHLHPDHAGDMVVAVCEDHFAVGTQGRENLEVAIDKVNRVSGVGIHMEIEEVPHEDGMDLYDDPSDHIAVGQRMMVELTELDPNGGTFDSSGSVFHWIEDLPEVDLWDWGNREQPAPRRSDFVVLAIHGGVGKGFPEYASDPQTVVDRAPSVGLLSHELGHAFQAGHDQDRTFTGDLDRDVALQQFAGMAANRGGTTLFHDGDPRHGTVTGYGKALLRHYYPTTDLLDRQPQWVNHLVLIVPRDTPSEEGAVVEAVGVASANPSLLRHDASTDQIVDCATGESPVFHMQYSDASDVPCHSGQPDLTVAFRIGPHRIASTSHEQQDCTNAFVHYDWIKPVVLYGTDFGGVGATETRDGELCSQVDPDGVLLDYDPSDQQWCVPITLIGADVAHQDCDS